MAIWFNPPIQSQSMNAQSPSPVLPPSSSSSPAANPPSSPSNRYTYPPMYPTNQFYHGTQYMSRQAGLTPYQYSMIMQPLPLQQLPMETNAIIANPVRSMPRVKRMEDLKAIPCPYLKNKGFCRFNENRCRYNHNFSHHRVEDDTEEEKSFNQAPVISTEESPATENTTPPLIQTAITVKNDEIPARNNVYMQDQPTFKETEKVQAVGNQANGKPEKTFTLNPPSKLYAAYDPEKMPDDKVYRVLNRKNPIDDARLSSIDQKTGQRMPIATDIREVRFEKSFGKAFDSHLRSISSHEGLAQSLSFLSITNASGLTDEAVIDFSFKCIPKVIILGGANQITDAGFLSLVLNCKGLEYLEITGYDNKIGRLTSSCLRMLTESPTVGKTLKEIVVKHHSISSQAALELSGARQTLAITTGNRVPGAKDLNIHLWCAGRLAFVNNFAVE
ncbi:hypothetical protein TWF696_001667 [Orbilia brochopaga]|uniref:C3H1-type domain-containing protein n=1 Tax=Orbilia brochopaga TaxID=3140254 RepID=A0AAV9U721_9PEZI